MSTKKGSLWPLAALALVFLAFAAMYSAFIAGGYILVPLNRLAPAALSTVITAAMVVLTVVGIRRNRAAAGGA
ncbi:MAG: hypothetical protein LBB46_03010, partial [Coriobacteriaceae bacterium]|nr:hypothetical protein [Coriobacteriaceae bacterium]